MERFSKLFGKKNDSPQNDEDSSLDAERLTTEELNGASEMTHNTIPGLKNPLPEIFGLKFILATGEQHLFENLPIRIGRDETNDLVIQDDTVSMVHAKVYFDEHVQDVCISDEDSLNGLLIDQFPTRKNILHDGVTISLGNTNLGFRDTGYIHRH